MAEIHLLPYNVDPAEAGRAVSVLVQAFEAGQDLGDRSHHIRSIGGALDTAQQQLRQLLIDIRELHSVDHPVRIAGLLSQVDAFAGDIERIAAFALSYEPVGAAVEATETQLR